MVSITVRLLKPLGDHTDLGNGDTVILKSPQSVGKQMYQVMGAPGRWSHLHSERRMLSICTLSCGFLIRNVH